MAGSNSQIQSVPTNIITGFLGVGKTTAILHFLKSKPANQRWAVLVNEFGEIGVDGGLMQGQHTREQGVFVREVPGGCMCCAAGLPMQVALNQLLASARPDRLLIEPTGLGHPKEVLQVLSGRMYRDTLHLQQIITLVNSLHLKDSRYTKNEIFNQQIEVADIVVGNKSDLYQLDDQESLRTYVRGKTAPGVKVMFTNNGEIPCSSLTGVARYAGRIDHGPPDHHHADPPVFVAETLPPCGYVKKVNQGDGFYSVGWRFREDMVFQRDELFSLLSGIDAERVKAVMNTDTGVLGYNKVSDALTEVPLFGHGQSCIEIICVSINDEWESQLLLCLANSQ